MTRRVKRQIFLNGMALVVLFVVLFHMLVSLWPAVDGAEVPITTTTTTAAVPVDAERHAVSFFFGWWDWTPSTGVALLLLVVVAGTLGSLVFTANSFATHVANRDFGVAWQWWYVLRPFIGAGLALITYLLIRGQLLGLSGPSEELNPYGVAGLAALTGLFSKQAIGKLKEVFDTIFSPGPNAENQAPSPTITSVDPATVTAGGDTAQTVTITGTGFHPNLTVAVGGGAVEVGEVTGTTAVVTVAPATFADPGELAVVVTNPDGGSAAGTITAA